MQCIVEATRLMVFDRLYEDDKAQRIFELAQTELAHPSLSTERESALSVDVSQLVIYGPVLRLAELSMKEVPRADWHS
jgi:hypothetical protein